MTSVDSDTSIDSLMVHKLPEIPDTIIYIPNFISEEEEKRLVDQVYLAPKPKWTHLSNRRLQNWGGLPHPKGMIAEEIPQWLDIYCKKIGDLGLFEGQKPNHVLVNEYLAGQGIMPHEDGPLFYPTVTTISLGSPTVLDFYRHLNQVTNSSGDNSTTDCQHSTTGSTGTESQATNYKDRHLSSVYLEPRSLVVVLDNMYKTYLHGIEERTEDHVTSQIANRNQCTNLSLDDVIPRTTRISLTIRVVPKVLKNKLFFGKKF